MCLTGNRFRVEGTWRTPNGNMGEAKVVKLTADAGYLWFFTPDNIEVVIKVNDAWVAPFNRFWVFASGLTNVEVQLTVTDTQNGEQWNGLNPLGQEFQPIFDTQAFATCP